MESTIGLKGKDWLIIASDTNLQSSVFLYSDNLDKTFVVDGDKLLSVVGPNSDVTSFIDIIQANLQFFKYRNGHRLTVEETAQFIRSTLAEAIRKQPYRVNCLYGGVDEEGAKLYWIDYLGTLGEIDRGAQGYCAYFVNGIFDVCEKKDLTLEEGLEIIQRAVVEIKRRFISNVSHFTVKVVTKEGVRVVAGPPKHLPQ